MICCLACKWCYVYLISTGCELLQSWTLRAAWLEYTMHLFAVTSVQLVSVSRRDLCFLGWYAVILGTVMASPSAAGPGSGFADMSRWCMRSEWLDEYSSELDWGECIDGHLSFGCKHLLWGSSVWCTTTQTANDMLPML